MRYTVLFATIATIGGLAGCSDSGPVAPRRLAPVSPVSLRSSGVRVLSPEEDRLVGALEAMFVGRDAPPFRAAISDRGIVRLSMPSNPRADSILAQLYAVRTAAAMARHSAAIASAPVVAPVTVALSEQADSAQADAIIWRRASQTPHDVIVLRRGATVAQLGAAVKVLGAVRRRTGNVPQTDEKILVHGSTMPRGWAARGADHELAARLAAAAASPQVQIRGLGTFRSFEVPLLGVSENAK